MNDTLYIKIGHLTYLVEYHDKDLMDSANRYGDCDHNKELIRLANGMSIGRETEVLLHEIMHAIVHVYGIKDDMKEEDTVTRMANGMAQVIMMNPKLWEWLNHSVIKLEDTPK